MDPGLAGFLGNMTSGQLRGWLRDDCFPGGNRFEEAKRAHEAGSNYRLQSGFLMYHKTLVKTLVNALIEAGIPAAIDEAAPARGAVVGNVPEASPQPSLTPLAWTIAEIMQIVGETEE